MHYSTFSCLHKVARCFVRFLSSPSLHTTVHKPSLVATVRTTSRFCKWMVCRFGPGMSSWLQRGCGFHIQDATNWLALVLRTVLYITYNKSLLLQKHKMQTLVPRSRKRLCWWPHSITGHKGVSDALRNSESVPSKVNLHKGINVYARHTFVGFYIFSCCWPQT